ncbi:DUF6301 family protein [Rothia sp. (in: high G+C Gram-positive bacteria)]|uniref:DUF6301 family protein n=1 Tax=Rothia sp. (in: high G+C Gram-positive bacteria) TaxID=1885016 RepID=UPI0026DCFA81|nr:DUF6301 family protein [Rothia sp. (in: high G+C Gram-positive bacteria)]
MAFSRLRLLSIVRIYQQALKIPEERPSSHMLNEANSTPSGFRAYPVEQAVAIIRAIAEHRWPISVEEAFSLRDQFGWTPAPDDGRFFVTPVSNGEEDGHIGLDVSDKNYISRIDFSLTTRVAGAANQTSSASLKSIYLTYVDKLTSIYGAGKVDSDDEVETIIWYLPSRASVGIGATRKFISVTIESPAMTDLTEAEEKYFAEGGEF